MDEVFEDFDILTRLPDLHEWPDIDETLGNLDNIIGPVHIKVDLVFLEVVVSVFSSVVVEGCLGSTEMAAEDKELLTSGLVRR